MDTLEHIIFTLSSDEVRRFKILSNRFKADEEKKLLVLFDAIREHEFSGDDIPYDAIIVKLYGNSDAKSKNSYYRLRNKLLGNIEKSLLFYHFNYHNALEPHSFVQLAYLMRGRNLWQETLYYLKKAEKTAEEQEQWALLELIYVEMLQLAQQEVEIDIDSIARRKVANRLRVLQFCSEQELIARICHQVKRKVVSRGKRAYSVNEIIASVLKEIPNGATLMATPAMQVAVYKAVSNILLRKSAYPELSAYIEEQMRAFQEANIFQKEHAGLRISMRIWQINTLRKLMRFSDEAIQLAALEQELSAGDGWEQYAFYYYNAKINNLKLNNQLEAAAETIQQALKDDNVQREPLNELYVYLSLADLHFCEHKPADALKVLRKRLLNADANALLSQEMNLFVAIFELVCAAEADEWEYVQQAAPAVKKMYRPLLREANYATAMLMVETLGQASGVVPSKRRSIYEEAWRTMKTLPPTEIADNHIIGYEHYLRAKAINTNYYAEVQAAIASA